MWATLPDITTDVSSVIGELRSFAQQQTITNNHMLEELKKIADRMLGFQEMGATFVEYRKTAHERWNRVHEQIGDIDERCDRMEASIDRLKEVISIWKGQLRSMVWAFGIGGTLIASLISSYSGMILRLAASHAQ